LKNLNIERDRNRKRDVLKKVIAYMTLGIDVSRLFTEMIMAIETKDIVVKKMVYLYLSTQAHKEPEMAIMCINSLRRECDNEDPMVRGLALRSLCNLRMSSILEYVQQPVTKGLGDLSAYVRRVAVMGVLKVHRLSPDTVETNGWSTQLTAMLQDVDSTVAGNVLFVINEMTMGVGGMEVTQALVMNLLNRLSEFNEWVLLAVLDFVSRYRPSAEDETFAIMNLLDPVLRSANSGAVLGTIKCFMALTEKFPELRPQIWIRAKPPLLTLVTGSAPETQFAVLKHLQLVLPEPAAKGVFDDEYRQLFVRYNEPPHVKHLKVDLLPLVTCENTARDVAAELAEYVTDVDSELAKHAIASMGHIAERIPAVAGTMVEVLVGLVDLDMPYVRGAAVVQMCSISRAQPGTAAAILPHLAKCLRKVEDPEARSSILWLLGEHCRQVPDAPYLLERMIDDFEDETSAVVKLALLAATAKCFFARAPEVQHMLGRLLKAALNDSADQDVHDRALMYYRLLRTDVNVAQKVLAAEVMPQLPEGGFAERRDYAKREALMAEFNTLAVVFGQPSRQFIGEEYQLRLDMAPIHDDTFAPQHVAPSSSSAAASAAVAADVGMGDLLGDWDGTPATATVTAASASGMFLSSGVSIMPQQFQQLWKELPPSFNGPLLSSPRVADSAAITAALARHNLSTVACGALPNGAGWKLFVYGSEPDTSSLLASGSFHHLAQLICTAGEATAMVKSSSPDGQAGEFLAALLRMALQ